MEAHLALQEMFLTALFQVVSDDIRDCGPCPAEDVVFLVLGPLGPMWVSITKGFFDDPENFTTRERFDEQRRGEKPSGETAPWQDKERKLSIRF